METPDLGENPTCTRAVIQEQENKSTTAAQVQETATGTGVPEEKKAELTTCTTVQEAKLIQKEKAKLTTNFQDKAAAPPSETEGACFKNHLPIHDHEEKLVNAIRESPVVVITGETGCGKTTQFPQFLHRAGFSCDSDGGGGMIAVTQPRRVAAISVAHRVSREMGTRLGEEVGYQIRFDDCTSPSTRIKYMTDGCLLREFLEDQQLSRYSVVVLDEAHERSLATDILFGLSKQLLERESSSSGQRTKRRKAGCSLKVVIMSATLDVAKFSKFFDSCPIFTIPGRTFPVSVQYNVSDDNFDPKKLTYLSQLSRVVMGIHLDQPEGDILVFLTGQSEIENACNKLFQMAEGIDYEHDVLCRSVRGLLILPLYGAMPTEHQQRVFEPVEEGIRRVVVATNIAATSLTISGVVYVVDCGYVKQLEYSPRSGLDSLMVVPIAKSEAIQRMGRAGRTSPGKCVRLYSKRYYDGLLEATVPEIQRTSLTSVVLSLKCMGIGNVLHFRYLDPPEEKMVLEALRQLYYFQAVDEDGRVTALGKKMVEYPVHPSLARVLIRSRELRCQEAVLPMVAMLSVDRVFQQPANKQQAELALRAHKDIAEAGGGTSDFSTLLAVYQLASNSNSRDFAGPSRKWCKENFVHWRAINTARSIHQQLQRILDKQEIEVTKEDSGLLSAPVSQRVRQCLCYGLFCNSARIAPGRKSFRTMDGHSTVAYLHPGSVLFDKHDSLDWVVYFELVDTAKTYMRTVCPVRYAWLQDLLPQLHDVDVYRLSECEKKQQQNDKEPTSDSDSNLADPPAKRPRTASTAAEVDGEGQVVECLKDRADSARKRYLARRKAGLS